MIPGPPVKVTAMGGRNVLLDREILDNAQVIVEYLGGKRATLELCLFAPYGGECEIGVLGQRGRIDTYNQQLKLVHHNFELPDRTEIVLADHGDEIGFQDSSGRVDRGILAELNQFLQCCRTGETPLTDGPSARLSVAVCLAAQESIRRGEMVTIEEMLNP